MPPQTGVSLLIAKLGNRAAQSFDRAKTSDSLPSAGGDLPADMTGIARLCTMRIAPIKAGKASAGMPLFYAEGIIHDPVKFVEANGNVFHAKGKKTRITENLFDTPTSAGRKTVDEHLDHMLKILRGLGIKTKNLDFRALDAVFDMLLKAKPFFGFHTFKMDPPKTGPNKDKKPMIIQMWDGLQEFEEAPIDPAGGFSDGSSNEETAPATAPQAPKTNRATAAPTKLQSGPKNSKLGPVQPPPEEPKEEFSEFDDLKSLMERAVTGEADAQLKLTDLALAKGWTEDQVNDAPNWEAIGDMAVTGPSEEAAAPPEEEPTVEPDGEPEPEPFPSAGQVCNYKPFDPKTKKYLNAVECTIESVDPAQETTVLKNLDDGKTIYKGVKWAKLEPFQG